MVFEMQDTGECGDIPLTGQLPWRAQSCKVFATCPVSLAVEKACASSNHSICGNLSKFAHRQFSWVVQGLVLPLRLLVWADFSTHMWVQSPSTCRSMCHLLQIHSTMVANGWLCDWTFGESKLMVCCICNEESFGAFQWVAKVLGVRRAVFF